MKITLGELKNAERALQKVINEPLPIKVSYQISKRIKLISEELANLENTRVKLVEKYGEKNEKGEIAVSPDNFPKFLEEFKILLEEEVDINITPIKLSEIADIKVSTIDILALGKLLEDDTQAK